MAAPAMHAGHGAVFASTAALTASAALTVLPRR
jgi:hypothetical protein